MSKLSQHFDKAGAVLLDTLPAWRIRAIERIELSSALWSERHREIHVRPFKEVMKENEEIERALIGLKKSQLRKPDSIDLVLPISELPKVPLLDLKVAVAGQRVHRVAKDESARIQARHVISLARKSLYLRQPPARLLDFLTFTFYHPSHPYEERLKRENANEEAASRAHLGEQLPFPVADDVVNHWWRHTAKIMNVARKHVVHDYLSGAENPLIGIPYMFQECQGRRPRPDALKEEDITELLSYLCRMVTRAHWKRKESPAAARFLSEYFTYGYRWMAFARCTVPLNKSFIITAQDKRAIYFTPERRLSRKFTNKEERKHKVWQTVSFADAETNHVSIRSSDTAIRLCKDPKVLNATKQDVVGKIDEEEITFELYARQDSTRGRTERIYIVTKLALTRVHSCMLYFLVAVTGFGILLLLNRGVGEIPWVVPFETTRVTGNGLTAKDATLILVPVAFAASLLLIKDSSTLSARLRRIRQAVLLVELFILLATTFVFILVHHIKEG